MTSIWLIAAVILVSFLLGFLSAALLFQHLQYKNTEKRLEARIQSLGVQLKWLPKRKSDRRLIDHED